MRKPLQNTKSPLTRKVKETKTMKKLFALILAVMLACGMFTATSFAAAKSPFEYSVNPDGTAEITKADPKLRDAAIPAELDGHTVTSIGWNAFYGCKSLTNVTLPDTVTCLRNFAFTDCANLKSINIPDSVTEIGPGAFSRCNKLSSIRISPNHPAFVFNNEMLIRKEDMALLKYTGQKAGAYEVFWGIKTICTGAFEETKLTSVVLPETVTVIEDYAFRSMRGLKEITLPDSLTSIGSQAFIGTGLASIKLPAGLTSISFGVFSWCSKLKSIEVDPANTVFEMQGNSLINKQDNDLVFHLDSDKGTYEIPEGIEKIHGGAFQDSSAMKELIMPDSVKEIGDSAFSSSSGLANVRLSRNLASIDGYAFYNCRALKSVTIPEGVTCISFSTFGSCTNLEEVILPASVTEIAPSAFMGCKKLTVKAPAGSYAEKFCRENSIPFAELK